MVCLAAILLASVLIPPLVTPSSAWNDPISNQYHIQTDEGPERYFKYQTQNGQYRKEKRLQDGTVIGTYAWIDGNGFLRQRDYIADGQGYRILKNKNLFVGNDVNIGDAMKAAKNVQNDYVVPNRINRVRNRGYVSITPKPNYAQSPSVELSLNSIQSSTTTPQTFYSSSFPYEAPSSTLSPPALSYIESSTTRPQASTSYLPPVSSSTLPPLVPSSTPSSIYLPASTPPPVSYPPPSVYLPAEPPASVSYIPPSSTPSPPVAYIPPSSTPTPIAYIPPSQEVYIPPSSTSSPKVYIPPSSSQPYIPPSPTPSPPAYIPPSSTPSTIYLPPSSTPSTVYLPASKPRPFAPPIYLPPSTTPSYVKITPPSRKYVPQSISSNSIEYSGDPQYEHYNENFVNPYIHQNGPTYPLDKNGHSFNAKYANIGNGYDAQYPYYDGISVTNDGFRYYIPRAYHEEQNTGYDSKSGSFGYIDPFGIRRVIYYNAGPDGFKHRKNNRYVGFDATPYDPRPY